LTPGPGWLNVPQAVWPLSDRGLAARLIDLATLRFLEGDQPFARQAFFADVHSIDGLAPDGAVLARELTQDNGDCQRLLLGDGWSLHLVLATRRPEVQVLVTARTAELADEVIGAVRRAVPPAEDTDGKARLTMWTSGSGGSPNRHRRWVDTPRWESIAQNYPGEVRTALARLTGLAEPPEHGGRLLLWYGEPGTGKTTAIRALGHEWRDWADIHFVLDPEAFFGSPEYLMGVVADEDLWDPRAPRTSRWKVLVVEDADELIRADARVDAGTSMSRLLNLTDGILGHGLRVLLLITTNEPMRGLHPAVVRPGRCLADVQFRPFSRTEAQTWLRGETELPAGDLTLAELYRSCGDLDPVTAHRAPEGDGRYL
jgi:Domain of unknown function (DUF5925)/ATPase family associated with various cellular activities (AAA)